MKTYYDEAGLSIIYGKSEVVLPTFAPSRFSTVITDPPYELGFMGKGWDSTGIAFRPELWAEVLRVCKPGAMLLAFGGTRTFHRLTCAIEDAGWEIRDCLMWLYGSGFPKSLDISKAIDKAAGAEREIVGPKIFADGTVAHAERPGGNDGWQRPWMKDPAARERVTGVTAPATDAAQEWSGWGTSLKPAWEPIIVAMKPLDGTFAGNALRHGAAGLNIDGGRIGAGDDRASGGDRPNRDGHPSWRFSDRQSERPSGGRWPANVVLDEVAAAQLDGIATTSGHGGWPARRGKGGISTSGHSGHAPGERREDIGTGASRFFYTAKASKSDRGHGNDHATVKPTALLKYLCKLTATPTGGEILDPFGGSMTTLVAAREFGRPAVAIEMVEDHCRIGVERLKQGVLFGATA